MVYPSFNYLTIQERCRADITQFFKLNNLSDLNNFKQYLDCNEFLFDITDNYNLDIIKNVFNKRILSNILGFSTKFNYNKSINELNKEEQQKLWIMRTYLFYQILIIATCSFKNNELYSLLYSDIDIFPFRDDIPTELDNFKIGIFGSINTTSDIDVAILYNGVNLNIPGLSYIISRLENLFIIFTDLTSLKWDIEFYADMLTLPNSDNNQSPFFYLNSEQFSVDNYRTVLPYAITSILRNYCFSQLDLESSSSKKDIFNVLDTFDINRVLSIIPDRIDFKIDNETIILAKDLVGNYLSASYDKARYKYYTYLFEAEQKQFDLIPRNNITIDTLNKLTNDNMAELMALFGKMDTFRMESYNCIPTVVFVVRILQAGKEKLSKYKTISPAIYCQSQIIQLDPFCSIGYYGYMLIILEQFGYIYRFNLTYCIKTDKHYDAAMCDKKVNKYHTRLLEALFYFNSYKPIIGGRIIGGGRIKSMRKLITRQQLKYKNKRLKTAKIAKIRRRKQKTKKQNIT